jgi:hypothetical protein
VEGWIEWVFGPGFSLFSCFFVVSRSFLVAYFVCWLVGVCFRSEFCMLRITGGILGIRDDGKDEEEDGGRGEPRASH